ncbi:uncharacterized protein LOC112906565 [Agrilus planipennis]|uniref:Uncharacterized protein LOC112906565 n=1 Tax=Agrilus planipennis TaxID=224129 RepID=A0A7F5RLG8_AGRPL|nr:uncharacterized protein LOC112906565 [Agrilus planipennis]
MGGKVVEETRQLGKEEKIEKNEDQEITQEEVEQVIKKLKKKKAAGEDKITNEAWIYGGKELQENLQGILNKIWNGDEDLPEEWKMGIIKPIFKKGDRHKPENYRGITLMNTGYKIYAEILRKRLEKELEDKKALGETQMGYRKNKGTIDAIYIVKTAIEEEIKKEKGEIFLFFADMKGAFDKLKRDTIWKTLEELNIENKLKERIREMYEETYFKI